MEYTGLPGAYLIEAHRIQNVPCRHLSAVFIARKSVGVVEVKRMQHLIHNLLRTPGLAYVVVEMGNVMAWLIAVGILAYQTGNIHRGRFTFQLGIGREQRIQLADEASRPPISSTNPSTSWGTNQVHCHAVPSQ